MSLLQKFKKMNSKKNNKVVFLTDSLSLPRDLPEKVSYEETYLYLLKEYFPNFEFIQFAFGGATINDLNKQADYIKSVNPSIVIIQSGIVDCAPRTLTRFELDFIHRIPLISNFILKVIRKNAILIRNNRKITYTKELDFELKLNNIKNKFNDSKVYAIEILPVSVEYEKKVPGITTNVIKYNMVLHSVFSENLIETKKFNKEEIMSDFFHLNKKGHKLIFEKLKIIFSA